MSEDKRAAAAKSFPELAAAAPILNRKRGWPIPLLPRPDVLGGCIYRPDEVVSSDHAIVSALRPVLRYRTTLARGEPDDKYREHWEAALLLFPRWVGFRPRRLRWTRWCEVAYRYMKGLTCELLEAADAWDVAGPPGEGPCTGSPATLDEDVDAAADSLPRTDSS